MIIDYLSELQLFLILISSEGINELSFLQIEGEDLRLVLVKEYQVAFIVEQ
jgi:hypothetical protein